MTHPLVDLAFFRIPAFTAALAIASIGFMVAFGTFLLVAQHLQLVLGMGPLEAGLWTVPSGLGFVVGSLVAPRLVRHWHRATVMAAGFVISALGFLMMSQGSPPEQLWLLVTGLTVLSLGLSQSATLTTDIVVGTVPPERAGSAAALSETSIEFGGALGIALLGSLVTAIYAARLTPALPTGLTAEAVAAADQGIGAAVLAAEALPPQLAEGLLAASRGAYGGAMEIAMLCGVVFSLAAAVMAWALLRKVVVGTH